MKKFSATLTMMMLIQSALIGSGSVSAFAPVSKSNHVTTESPSPIVLFESKEDLKELGKKLNPVLGYYDPLSLTQREFWGFDEASTIGWLRHSEIKHGRVAMAAFVGYCVQSNFVVPWAMTMEGEPFPSIELSPPEQWDALPLTAKMQIILFVGFLEFYSELTPKEGVVGGLQHYTKGGIPGKYPTFDAIPHPVPNLYDPFGINRKMSNETKARRLRAEINNGRLAQIGIFAFLCEQTIPGSVPALDGIVAAYSGEVMAPFSADFNL